MLTDDQRVDFGDEMGELEELARRAARRLMRRDPGWEGRFADDVALLRSRASELAGKLELLGLIGPP